MNWENDSYFALTCIILYGKGIKVGMIYSLYVSLSIYFICITRKFNRDKKE